MRPPRSSLQPASPAPRKRAGRAAPAHLFTPDDVLWWAAVNQREPFITAARLIRQSRGAAKAVRWHDDNTMSLVTR